MEPAAPIARAIHENESGFRAPAGSGREKVMMLKAARPAKLSNFSYVTTSAARVQLAGCFTNWLERPINLRKRSNGVWWTAVRLRRGTYYYRFLVDGQWCDDPECPLVVPNPFGGMNAVRQVD